MVAAVSTLAVVGLALLTGRHITSGHPALAAGLATLATLITAATVIVVTSRRRRRPPGKLPRSRPTRPSLDT